jgi:hypothetical protein
VVRHNCDLVEAVIIFEIQEFVSRNAQEEILALGISATTSFNYFHSLGGI